MRNILEQDKNWFFELYTKYKDELDSIPEEVWKNTNYKIICIPYNAFLVYSRLSDGTTVINALVSEIDGGGSLLINSLNSYPILVATKSAGKFYMKNGFSDFGIICNKKGQVLYSYIKEHP
jgi:hypothetical protein